jgi:1-acyl-sn-glycerol-3-phosphate acyltransferase
MLRKIIKTLFLILNALLFRVDYINWDKIPLQGPAIIVANHQHFFDVSFIHCKSKAWINWVAKKELFDTPLIGRHIHRMGVMSVDRDKSDIAVAKSMLIKLKNNEIIGIFPQGTRMRTPEDVHRIVPKTGAIHMAIRTGASIIPIGISGSFKLFSRIKVIAGDPVDFSKMPVNGSDNENLMNRTIYVMTKIYELIGIEYRLDAVQPAAKGSV